jgi:hypothetical protein
VGNRKAKFGKTAVDEFTACYTKQVKTLLPHVLITWLRVPDLAFLMGRKANFGDSAPTGQMMA